MASFRKTAFPTRAAFVSQIAAFQPQPGILFRKIRHLFAHSHGKQSEPMCATPLVGSFGNSVIAAAEWLRSDRSSDYHANIYYTLITIHCILECNWPVYGMVGAVFA